ncbi:hypothetical protein [Streptomyces sp. NRRL B-24484]|uniref:hypothetical protein n=1 Tax=Streptomyces sp. NRRL B-24484 TaxID=1463833 RepID=UPI0004C11182|nr:hypothetical protein [Streptomyces sp. NRRL B-24484]
MRATAEVVDHCHGALTGDEQLVDTRHCLGAGRTAMAAEVTRLLRALRAAPARASLRTFSPRSLVGSTSHPRCVGHHGRAVADHPGPGGQSAAAAARNPVAASARVRGTPGSPRGL